MMEKVDGDLLWEGMMVFSMCGGFAK